MHPPPRLLARWTSVGAFARLKRWTFFFRFLFFLFGAYQAFFPFNPVLSLKRSLWDPFWRGGSFVGCLMRPWQVPGRCFGQFLVLGRSSVFLQMLSGRPPCTCRFLILIRASKFSTNAWLSIFRTENMYVRLKLLLKCLDTRRVLLRTLYTAVYIVLVSWKFASYLFSHELIAATQSVVTGQAPITLERKITSGGETTKKEKMIHTIT